MMNSITNSYYLWLFHKTIAEQKQSVCAMTIALGHQREIFLDWNSGLELRQAISLFLLLAGIPIVSLYGFKKLLGRSETLLGKTQSAIGPSIT